MSSDVSSFDPAIAYDFFSNAIVHSLFDTLVTYDEGTNIVPGIAAAMPTISADGLTYTFDLRPDVSFVRKGEILPARDRRRRGVLHQPAAASGPRPDPVPGRPIVLLHHRGRGRGARGHR